MLSLRIEMDVLASFFSQFTLSASVFFSGRLCGTSGDHRTETAGHLHLLRRGTLRIDRKAGKPIVLCEPSVLFYPRPLLHRFKTDEASGAELVCARVEFGAGMLNPLVRALPELVIVPLNAMPTLAPAMEMLFVEAFAELPGRQAAVDRLAEYVLLLLLREAAAHRLIDKGVLAGLADPRLEKAIGAIHESPEHQWTLEELAAIAGMSRARFADQFKHTVGITPFDYLAQWRVGVAQSLLIKGQPLKIIAPTVGYSTSAALSRVFVQVTGEPPTRWLSRTSAV